MSTEEKKKLSVMLKRIQGQVGGIERMVSEDKGCEAVVTQITAAMSSLKSVAKTLLSDAVGSCSKEEYAKLLKRFL
jgi:DNA-binding FrmR family transcriptional regulator